MYATLVSVGFNIIMNIILCALGVYGLALATTLSAFVRLVILMCMSKKDYDRHNEKMLPSSVVKYCIASLVMLVVLIVIRGGLKSKLGLYGYTFTSVTIGAMVYFIALILLRTDELIELKDMTIKFLNRVRRSA